MFFYRLWWNCSGMWRRIPSDTDVRGGACFEHAWETPEPREYRVSFLSWQPSSSDSLIWKSENLLCSPQRLGKRKWIKVGAPLAGDDLSSGSSIVAALLRWWIHVYCTCYRRHSHLSYFRILWKYHHDKTIDEEPGFVTANGIRLERTCRSERRRQCHHHCSLYIVCRCRETWAPTLQCFMLHLTSGSLACVPPDFN